MYSHVNCLSRGFQRENITDRQTDGQRQRQTGRQTDRQRQTDATENITIRRIRGYGYDQQRNQKLLYRVAQNKWHNLFCTP